MEIVTVLILCDHFYLLMWVRRVAFLLIVPFLHLQLATNLRDAIGSWNLGTNRWLRLVVYERVPKKYGTLLTFMLSALWHGFYPGYYLTFASGALIVTAARTVSSPLIWITFIIDSLFLIKALIALFVICICREENCSAIAFNIRHCLVCSMMF